MILRDLRTGADVKAEILRVEAGEFAEIVKDPRFAFDWIRYKKYEVYKLCLQGDELILGLICLLDNAEEGFESIKIELLESSAENIGSKKRYDRIAGCLIAFACRESLRRGRGGYVFLIPKTELIFHYCSQYGFEHFPFKTDGRPEGFMVLYDTASRRLISQYLS